MVDSSCTTENRQQTTDATSTVPERQAKGNLSPESSEEDRDATVKTLEKTFEERDTLNQAVVRIVNEAARAYETREIIPPASIKKAMRVQAEADGRTRLARRRSTRLGQC